MRLRLVHLLAGLFLAFVLPVFAGSGHRGQVKLNGLPVPGATVTARKGDAQLAAVTDALGNYAFPELTEGIWMLELEMLGFEPARKEISVGSETSPLEWELVMLPLVRMNTERMKAVPSDAGAAFQQTEAQEKGPGAKPENAQPSGAAAQPSAFANLTQEQLTERAADGFLINGSVNNGAASPFAQLAAFGNNRAGFRALYNGSLGLNIRNSALDARSFSLTGQETPKPDYNYSQLSMNVGGPLRIPHVLEKGPTFYVGYQRVQDRNALIRTGRMPTAAERKGDLSGVRSPLGEPIRIVNPETGLPFDGNLIPEERISPQAQALLALYPLPNYTGSSRYNYQIPVVSTSHQDLIQARLYKWSFGSQISGNFSYLTNRSDNPDIFSFVDKGRSKSLNLETNYSHRFNQQRLNIWLKYQFGRTTRRTIPYFANRTNISGEAGITGNNQDPGNWGPPSLSFSNYERLAGGQNSYDREQTNGVSGGVQLNKAGHNLSIGSEFRRQQVNLLSQQNARGSFGFTGGAAGYDFAGFLLGIPDTASVAFGNPDKYFRSSTYAAYLSDDWRMKDSFTLSLGVRWEYESPLTELYDRLVNLDIERGFGAVAPVLANNPTGILTGRHYPNSLVNPNKSGIQPRIGFAWRPTAASSVVVRGGYGIYRDTSVYRQIASQMAQQSPFSKSMVVGNSPATPLTLASGFSSQPKDTVPTFAIDPDFRVAYAQNWQLSVQRDLPLSLQAVVLYLGSKGSNLTRRSLPNTYAAAGANEGRIAGFVYQSSGGESIRHAGQVQVRRRLRKGFAANVQYTYSKSIDDAALGSSGQGGSAIAQNWLDLRAERGLSSFDQRHLVNLQTQYTTGATLAGSALTGGWRRELLKEWNISLQMAVGSGLPLNPIYPGVVSGTGITGSVRPDRTAAPIKAAPRGLHLNPAAFTPPAEGEWGNAGRNSITGPGQFSFDASLGRTFRVRDRYTIDFRLDSKNILNHVTYPGWNTTVNSALFGLPERANQMRNIVANLRVSF